MYPRLAPWSQPGPSTSSGQRVWARRSRKSSRVAWGMFILNDWILMLHFSFLLFVVMKNKRWLCAVSRASLSVPTVVVIKRRISFDASTKYNILLKEDRIDPR